MQLVDGQVSTMRNNVPRGYRRRYRTRGFIRCGLWSIPEFVSMPCKRMMMFLARVALVTLASFSCARSSRVGFLAVLLLVVGFIDLMTASVERFAIGGEVCRTRKFKQTSVNINKIQRVLRVEVANDIVHSSGKRYETIASFEFIELQVLREMVIG